MLSVELLAEFQDTILSSDKFNSVKAVAIASIYDNLKWPILEFMAKNKLGNYTEEMQSFLREKVADELTEAIDDIVKTIPLGVVILGTDARTNWDNKSSLTVDASLIMQVDNAVKAKSDVVVKE